MAVHESTENYLEAILILQARHGAVRSIDIANELDFTRPSVSVAMKKLRESGHIQVDSEGYITFTESGRKAAEEIYERHAILAGFLTSLGVEEKSATEDACRMEHVISRESFEKIQELVLRGFTIK